MVTPSFLHDFYDDYPRVEEAFQTALDHSIKPRGPEMLYGIVAELTLPPRSRVLDLGCGEGPHSIELARRFGLMVQGIDPVQRHLQLAGQALASAAETEARLRGLVGFAVGAAESLPLPDGGFDLIWCRDVLVHVRDLETAFAECSRTLRSGGRMLVYHTFVTDRLEPGEAEWLCTTMGVVPASATPVTFESAFAGAGFRAERRIDLASEWEEHAEEQNRRGSSHLLHAARLLRQPHRYIEEFGQTSYDIKLGDSLWHIYIMLGKLNPCLYLLGKE